MNEKELEGLMKGYGDSFGTCDRTPAKRASHWPRRLALASVSCLAIGAAAVAMWPHNAAAAKLRSIATAVRNARTLELSWSRLMPSGKWWEWAHCYNAGGMLRNDAIVGSGLAETIITRDGLQYDDYHRLDHVTLRRDPFHEERTILEERSALDFALDMVDTSRRTSGKPRCRVVTRNHEDVNGRAVYLIVVDQPDGTYHGEILVDQLSDLPIEAETNQHVGGNVGDLRMRQEYRFNAALDPLLFSSNPSKRVVDLRRAQETLENKWQKVLGSVGNSAVRDACVTTDGTVWVALTAQGMGTMPLPSSITTQQGATYVRLWDTVPTLWQPVYTNGEEEYREPEVRVFGQKVVVVGFFPLDATAPVPNSALVHFARRPIRDTFGDDPNDEPAGAMLDDLLTLPLRREPGPVPSYFAELNLDHLSAKLGECIWRLRADALERDGKLLDAAHSFERTARECVVKYSGYRELDKAAACYDKLGMAAEAARDRKQAIALHAARER
ncbi:MAG: hypothetical protein ACHQ50_06255 [Fimbriimonadales bacterium]